MKKIEVMQDVLSANDLIAKENRDTFLKNNTLAINIMSSPGSGKTSTILQTIKHLPDWKILVIEGDVAGDIDAKKIEKTGTDVIQINTSGACHLDARMIHKALNNLEKQKYDLVLIENVGNLICPTSYDLGESKKIVILSVPEGEDKPLKYPKIFQIADLLLVNKIDMLSVADFNQSDFIKILEDINPTLNTIEISSKTGEGIKKWTEWLKTNKE